MYLWTSDVPVEQPCYTCGPTMPYLWTNDEVPVDHPCTYWPTVPSIPVEQPCHTCGATMPYLWTNHAIPVDQPCHTCGPTVPYLWTHRSLPVFRRVKWAEMLMAAWPLWRVTMAWHRKVRPRSSEAMIWEMELLHGFWHSSQEAGSTDDSLLIKSHCSLGCFLCHQAHVTWWPEPNTDNLLSFACDFCLFSCIILYVNFRVGLCSAYV